MEAPIPHNMFDRRPIFRSKSPSVKWVKEWVPQDVVATGGKCSVMKWVREDTLRALKEKVKEPESVDPEPEPTSEVLFLCSYESCGKTFIDAGALRKHSHIHGERQYLCHYEGCGKKFLDSSKLKRHFLIHTGERDFVCPHEGCGKAFSLDFNLRSHMKTHSQENYHICRYADCGKRFAHEYKLKNHISSHHEKNPAEVPKYTPPPVVEKPVKTTKPSSSNFGSASSARPYGCPYEGCGKAYIHEYKLNLHLRREHPDHYTDDNHHSKTSQLNNNNLVDNEMDEDRDAYSGKRVNSKSSKHSKPSMKQPPTKTVRKGGPTNVGPANVSLMKKPWPTARDQVYAEEDSEETEEDRDNGEDGWRYGDNNEDDDEETEYED